MSETEDSKKQQAKIKLIVSVVAAVIIAWYFFGGGLEKQTANSMQQIENQVASDAIAQYDIAKRNGSAMDAYVQASLVTASFLQAKDEYNYQKWKAIERAEAKRAGMPKEAQ